MRPEPILATAQALSVALALVLALPGLAASAATLESAAAIRTAIEASLKGATGKVQPNGGTLMPACHGALGVRWMPSGNPDFRTAEVSCPSPAWTVYAGVRLGHTRPVLVATRAIAPGGQITAADTAPGTVAIARLHGTPVDAAALGPGLTARQPIAAGQPITREMTGAAVALRSGQAIRLTVAQGALTVSTPGRALQDGALGDTVLVENAATHRRLRATLVRALPARPGLYIVVSDVPPG